MRAHGDALERLLGALAGGFSPLLQLFAANTWLFGGLLTRVFAAKPKTATLVRTTTALTVVRGGEKANVLPARASALVNHRVHSRDSIASVIAHDKYVIGDPRVKIEVLDAVEPAPVASTRHAAFRTLRDAVFEIFPGASVAPGLFIAGSDSKHFWGVARQVRSKRTAEEGFAAARRRRGRRRRVWRR